VSEQHKISLSLSGGGFRATLFHLGVVRFLYEAESVHKGRLLDSVHRIGAVSGGSILGAHLVLNWERYTGEPDEFDAAARQMIDFVRSDVRGRIVRRWILGWLLLAPRLLRGRYWTLSNLLQVEYKRLYGDARLKDLRAPTKSARPQLFLNCTSLTTGWPCCFGRSGFTWYEKDEEKSITSPETQVSFAVAASSAFPPLFPPIAISHNVLSCDRSQFPNPQDLTDGGVYDNLGIDQLMWCHKRASDTHLFLISDAGGNFDWEVDKKYWFITSRNIRASDLLMKRVSILEYALLSGVNTVTLPIKIADELEHTGDNAVLSPEIQRSLRNIRTDLDAFSANEINCLVQHGFMVARETARANGLVSGELPGFSWKPAGAHVPNLKLIRKSGSRRLRLWSPRDWVSWASLCVVAAASILVVGPIYLHQRQLLDQVANQQQLIQQQGEAQNKLLNRVVEPAGVRSYAVSGSFQQSYKFSSDSTVGIDAISGLEVSANITVLGPDGGKEKFVGRPAYNLNRIWQWQTQGSLGGSLDLQDQEHTFVQYAGNVVLSSSAYWTPVIGHNVTSSDTVLKPIANSATLP